MNSQAHVCYNRFHWCLLMDRQSFYSGEPTRCRLKIKEKDVRYYSVITVIRIIIVQNWF